MLKESAKNAPNRGYVFTFEEFRLIIMTRWNPEMEIDFANWISKRFMVNTLLLGALRNEQLERFRKGGLKSIEWKRDHRNEHGFLCPIATSTYNRVKPRNAANPNRPDEDFTLTIVCTCKGGHKKLVVELDQKGRLKQPQVIGNERCWYGNLVYLTEHLQNPETKLLQKYNVKQKKFGTKNVGRAVAQKSLADFCELVGVRKEGINNMWARKTFVRASVRKFLI